MEFHTSIFICIAFLSAYAVTIEIDVDTFREEIKQMIVNDATFREEIKMMIVNDATFRADIIQMIVQNKNFEWEVKLITFEEFDKQNTRFAQKLQNDTRNQVNEALQKLNEIEEQLKTLQGMV